LFFISVPVPKHVFIILSSVGEVCLVETDKSIASSKLKAIDYA